MYGTTQNTDRNLEYGHSVGPPCTKVGGTRAEPRRTNKWTRHILAALARAASKLCRKWILWPRFSTAASPNSPWTDRTYLPCSDNHEIVLSSSPHRVTVHFSSPPLSCSTCRRLGRTLLEVDEGVSGHIREERCCW